MKNKKQNILVLTLLTLNLTIPATALALPPKLTADWWQWAFSIPNVPPTVGDSISIHPLVGDDGDNNLFEYCGVGQHGPVWFLGGDFSGSGEPFTRTCKVPAGKAILLAVINGECSTAEGDANPSDPVLVKAKDLAKCARDQIEVVDVAEATLNGYPLVVKKISTAKPFSVLFPPSNIIELAPLANPSLSQASGFWVFIPALKPGTHILEFTGGITEFSFFINGTYNIQIVPQSEQ